MKNKPRILIVSPHKVGLTETFIRAHIEQLDAEVSYLYGWDLDFKTVEDVPLTQLYAPKENLGTKLRSALPHYLYFRLKQKEQKLNTKEALLKRFIKDQKIELVLAEYGTAGSAIAPICNSLNKPLIVHFHGFDASRYDVLKKYEAGYQQMFQIVHKIIVVSEAMFKTLVELGCPEDKLALNTYGPHPDYQDVVPDYSSDFLISVGRHTYKKAPYLTILAFQRVLATYPDLKLKMIGDGELYDVSRNLVKSLGLENKVVLLGGLDREAIIEHLNTAFAFAQHSVVAYNGDSEGTPVGIIEAMASGLPVVSTFHAGIPDVVMNEETGFLVEENNIESMSKYILKLASDRSLAKQMGLRGKSRIMDHFTLRGHLEVINRLIYECV